MNSGEEISGCVKIKQLQTKLPRTAAIEKKLLSDFDRRANKVIAAALTSGENKTIQDKLEFIRSARESRE